MYAYLWDNHTRAFILVPQNSTGVSGGLRPVFREELEETGLGARFDFASAATAPLLWADKNRYFLQGIEVARTEKAVWKQPLKFAFNEAGFPELAQNRGLALTAVDIEAFRAKNSAALSALTQDAIRKIKELYDYCAGQTDIVYIAFSGGKDSMVLLDLCHQALSPDVPVVFSDTDMELPSTYDLWARIKARYPERPFIRARSHLKAEQSWRLFGPPGRSLRWCCAVHKNAPALAKLKEYCGKTDLRAAAFVGVRREESFARRMYEEIGDGVKNPTQINLAPLLDWASHEIWLYTLARALPVNAAYRLGFARVGCVLCPESSERHSWNSQKFFGAEVGKLADIIIATSGKDLSGQAARDDFIGKRHWQARKSGAALKAGLSRPQCLETETGAVFSCSAFAPARFFEWLKTIGAVFAKSRREYEIITADGSFCCFLDPLKNEINVVFASDAAKKKILPAVRKIIHKAIACVGCRVCQAACPTGALRMRGAQAKIDADKCTHCLRCQFLNLGCWRFDSLVMPDAPAKSFKGFNLYKTFGLRSEFLEVLLATREKFADPAVNTRMNIDKQVASAKCWFRQAELLDGNRPTRLLELFAAPGGMTRRENWHLLWFNLANNAPLIRVFILRLRLGQVYADEELWAALAEDIGEKSRKGALSSLKNTLRASPFGRQVEDIHKPPPDVVGACPAVFTGNSRMTAIARQPVNPDRLALLYCLFWIAAKTGRRSFTVRELLAADMDSDYISPLVAFGADTEEFVKTCRGLSVSHPDYLSCNFTLNLDEINLRTDSKTLSDVIDLLARDQGGDNAI